MKILMCIVFAALFGGIAVFAKTLQNDEIIEEIKELLEIDSQDLEHQQGVGDHVARSLETRGKKKKKPKNKNKNKNKKKPNKSDTDNGGTGNTGDSGETGNSGGNPVTLPNGVKQHPSITVYQKGKPMKFSVKETSLHCHNFIRGIYGVPALVWDEALAKTAQKHADELAEAGKLYHSKGNYGENVGYHSISIQDTVYTPAFTCFDWWVECENPGYDYSNPKYESGTGHFTQVVWKGSQKVGCAVSTKFSKMENTYLVCQYYPPGNFIGQFAANVPKPKKSLPKSAKDVALEGCCDYNANCGKYSSMCSKYDFLRKACCDTCN